MSEWISVDDDYPESGQNVLTYNPTGPVTYGIRQFVEHNEHYMWDGEVVGRHYLLRQYPITHWIPLPDAPASEGRADE